MCLIETIIPCIILSVMFIKIKPNEEINVSHDMRTSEMLAIGLAYYHLNRHSGCVIRPSLVALIEGPLKAGSSPTD
ncbi:hypothetical protein ANTRET_LOCUS4178 [Anthophora retusa]